MADTTLLILAATVIGLVLGNLSRKASNKGMGLITPEIPYDRYHEVR